MLSVYVNVARQGSRNTRANAACEADEDPAERSRRALACFASLRLGGELQAAGQRRPGDVDAGIKA
jgi:hypothetical protein